MPTVLIDTSLLIEQQKQRRYATPVRAALSRFSFRGASSYSKLEMKRAWWRHLGYIHSQCRKSTVHSIADVAAIIESRLRSHQQQRPTQSCLQAFHKFLELGEHSFTGRVEVARLAAHIRHALLSSAEHVSEMVTHQFEGTKCIRAEELPKALSDGGVDVTVRRCKPAKIQCEVHLFFRRHRGEFQRIAKAIEAEATPSVQLKTMAESIRLAEKSAEYLCDDRHCAKIADAIIAVDGVKMDVFAANNDAEWVLLAKVLKKPLVNPVRPSEPGQELAPPAPPASH